MVSVAIIDTIGLVYDGDTLKKRGLGGSESAVILLSRELVKLGFKVTVFNNCSDSTSKPGVYDGVTYNPFDVNLVERYDMVISSRTTVPFSNIEQFNHYNNVPFSFEFADRIKNSTNYRVLWLHDTFCIGDQFVESMVMDGTIHELFTLSDFHTTYVTNCDHGHRRNFEVLKNKIFQTRNGVDLHKDWVDIKQKDPNLFVYNASVTKGMIPLVTRIWPEIQKRIPQAKLKIIGGFYRFRDGAPPDKQEEDWHKLRAEYEAKNIGIEFTGIIPQTQIADILEKASFFLYPGAFPETYGISMMESMAYNTPMVTCRFGAMEENAISNANYVIDYAIEPNSLFTTINTEEQIVKFINTVLAAYQNTYLHQQKMYYCNIIKPTIGWDSVALQWKQHIYKMLGLYLSVDEYRKVQNINTRIHQIFGRRFINHEEIATPKRTEQRILVVVPYYNCKQYISRCIRSIAAQDYDNYKVVLINDASTDTTKFVVEDTLNHFPETIRSKFVVINNETNKGAVCNQITAMNQHGLANDIVMLVDGDDALVNNPSIFDMYNNMYDGTTVFTYGSCWSLADNIPLIAQPYPKEVREKGTYREYKFNWGMPYTHLRTFRGYLAGLIPEEAFKDENGEWFRAGGDNAVFYNLIEKANPNCIKVVSDIVYLYNDTNPLNDYKINSDEQTRNSNKIVSKEQNMENKIKNFNDKIMQNHDVIDGVGPWVQRVGDIGSWEWPKADWINHIRDGIKRHVPKKGVAVQAGGNMGMYPRLLAEMFDKVYTFEPDPLNFHCLSMNCNHPNIYKMQAALGAYSKMIDLEPVCPDNSGVIFIRDKPNATIPMVTIDSLELEACDLIQLDVEQYEPYAIMGAVKTIEKFHPVITLEGPEVTRNVALHILNFLGYEAVDRIANDTVFVWKNFKPEPLHYVSPNESVERDAKHILIAIPTRKNIEADTFKSIYDLEIPAGYKVTFQYFYGYAVDQVRNLIADWVVKGYDYLFAVDSDVVFPRDTLKKLLAHDKDVVSGLYIQRFHDQHNLELFGPNGRINYEDIEGRGLIEIDGCGFGCVLVKKQVFAAVGYPQFVYHQALDHRNTISEDTDFCRKAKEKGFGIYADTSIICDHIGSYTHKVKGTDLSREEQRIIGIYHDETRMPQEHKDYLKLIRDINPKIIYDIGSCALNWTKAAREVWPDAKYYAFDAIAEAEALYKRSNLGGYHIGILSDRDNRQVTFYRNKEHPGGNSYYKENPEVNPYCEGMYEDSIVATTRSLDSITAQKGFPAPDLIKIDVQGAELDILKGAESSIRCANHLIIELQHTEYNKGAPNRDEVIQYLNSIGYRLVGNFAMTPFDGDYYFTKV